MTGNRGLMRFQAVSVSSPRPTMSQGEQIPGLMNSSHVADLITYRTCASEPCLYSPSFTLSARCAGGKLRLCDGIDLALESSFDRVWHVDGTNGHRSWRSRRISASHQGGQGLGILRKQELGLLNLLVTGLLALG